LGVCIRNDQDDANKHRVGHLFRIKGENVKFPLALPAVKQAGLFPEWTGKGFRIGTNYCPVLVYSNNPEGWTDDLTYLHENAGKANHWIDLASRRYALRELEKYIPAPQDKVILEIGCSSGNMLRLMRGRFPGAIIIGSDCISGPLRNLAVEFPDMPLIQFDLLRCPLPEGSVDVVVLLNVLEHIQDDAAALRQIYRILKPGGVIVLEVPAGPGLYDYYDKTLMHCRRYSRSALCRLVEETGFTIASSSHLGYFAFPAFWLVKKRNRRMLDRNADELKNTVKKYISKTKSNGILSLLMSLELACGKIFNYPVGIRCVMTCVKSS
jgi:ubiquinone/menaquinone biosynthesis C-methylase UbiE